jgi:hypothetical protein
MSCFDISDLQSYQYMEVEKASSPVVYCKYHADQLLQLLECKLRLDKELERKFPNMAETEAKII